MNIINRKDQTEEATWKKEREEERRMWEKKQEDDERKRGGRQHACMEMRKEIHDVRQMHRDREEEMSIFTSGWYRGRGM